jgi:hypothetical protein
MAANGQASGSNGHSDLHEVEKPTAKKERAAVKAGK